MKQALSTNKMKQQMYGPDLHQLWEVYGTRKRKKQAGKDPNMPPSEFAKPTQSATNKQSLLWAQQCIN